MYLALYRKYRPKGFDSVISQPHITTTLKNQINAGKIGHAYLFTGSRGTGKTTCAKILAKAINCLSPKDGNPCLECSACLNADNSPDIAEIDAASNNGVDDIRSLRDEIAYLPTELRFKVYIIDEVHMLSTSAFNALLKTLEEPPKRVVFILATTESHKIPLTVLSRCQLYEFNRIEPSESANALMKIAEEEGVTLERDAALLISRLSDGGMRDALSLLDVSISKSLMSGDNLQTESSQTKEAKTIDTELVRDSAGLVGTDHLFKIIDTLLKHDPVELMEILTGLYSKSKDPVRLIDELLNHLRNLMITKLAGEESPLLSVSAGDRVLYKEQSNRFELGGIIFILDHLEQARRNRLTRTGVEICLMKLCVMGNRRTAPSLQSQPRTQPPMPQEQPPIPQEQPPMPQEQSQPLQVQAQERPSMGEGLKGDEWGKIFNEMDEYRRLVLKNANVRIQSGVIIFDENKVISDFFDNPTNRVFVEKTAREVLGKDLKVVLDKGDNTANDESGFSETSEINEFLNKVEKAGIQLLIE